MTIKTILAVFALSLAPTLSLANCIGDTAAHVVTASCAEGSVFDTVKGACVPQTNS